MNIKKIPVYMIGAGRIGFKLEFDKKRIKPATHYGMWIKDRKFQLKGIAEINKIKKKLSKKINSNIRIYSNYKKMINLNSPQIVSISTWKDTHFEISNFCIDHGVKVIVLEKPLANNLTEAKNLLLKAKSKNTKIIVNHRRRFDEDIINLHKKIKNGFIGEILQVSSYYVYGLLTTGTHLIDTLRMLLNSTCGEVTQVSGFKNVKKNFKPKDDENYDAILKFKNGLTATVQNLDMKSYDNFDIQIYGSKGKILISGIGRDIFYYKVIKSPEHSGFTELTKKPIQINKSKPRLQFLKLSQNAFDCLIKNKQPLCSAHDSFLDMLIIDRIIESAKNNSKLIKINL